MKREILFFVFMLGTASAFAGNLVSGQLMFTLKSASQAITADAVPNAPYKEIETDLQQSPLDGTKIMSELRAMDEDDSHTQLGDVLDSTAAAVKAAINPTGLSVDQFRSQTTNAWDQPFTQYVSADDDSDVPFYQQINQDLRGNAPVPANEIAWVNSMRQALWHLPRFVGLSFRGTRLLPAKIDQYYQVGRMALDKAFVSSSERPNVALRFASPQTPQQLGTPAQEAADPNSDTKKIAIIFVVEGKSGRPISFFADSDQREQEILFANGTPMTVVSRSEVFTDATLGKSEIIVLREN